MGTVGELLQQQPDLWRADQLGQHRLHSLSTGYAALNRELPGDGWPVNTLTELLLNQHGIGELRLLMPSLLQVARQQKTIMLLAPPHLPLAEAFKQFGLPLERLLIIEAEQNSDRLWALEKMLRSNQSGALLAWLPEQTVLARQDQIRRLQMAAQQSNGLNFLFRPSKAQHHASPAPLRIHLSAAGPSRLRVEVIKRRGPVMSQSLMIELIEPAAWLPRAYNVSPMSEFDSDASQGMHHEVDCYPAGEPGTHLTGSTQSC